MFSSSALDALAECIDSQFPLRHDPRVKPLAYGTAGFRTTGSLLPPVAARVVVIAVIRAWYCERAASSSKTAAAATVGFMITASHNPAADNGFKIIDTDGGMLAASWEHWCTAAANAETGADVVHIVRRCLEDAGLGQASAAEKFCGRLLLGRDTRDSGPEIEAAATQVIGAALQLQFTSYGIVTTPQLHFLVAKANESDSKASDLHLDVYHELILSQLEQLLQRVPATEGKRRVVVDCANGVGAIGLRRLLEYSSSRPGGDVLSSAFSFELLNDAVMDAALLNECCGADYAKQHAQPSEAMRQWRGLSAGAEAAAEPHFYCLDGDADRLVAFLHRGGDSPSWVLLDGDRIAILYAMLLHKWLGEERMSQLDVGVVQTAYANGASTEFLTSALRMPVYIAATGVKNLHPVASARDIGVYFEANGHGTVLFSDALSSGHSGNGTGEVNSLITELRGLLSQVCGDAIGDLLMCEVALLALGMSVEAWASLYLDRPCKQVKVTVSHPKRITNTADEQRALLPDGLQGDIDAAVSAALLKCAAARSFVRPSGTEPVVRVYAEASTPEVCDELAADVCKLVEKYCN